MLIEFQLWKSPQTGFSNLGWQLLYHSMCWRVF